MADHQPRQYKQPVVNPHAKWLFSLEAPYKTISNSRQEEIDLLNAGWRDTPYTDEEIKAAAAAVPKPEEPSLAYQLNPPIELKDPVSVDLEFTREELTAPIEERMKDLFPPKSVLEPQVQATADQIDAEAAEFARQSVLEQLPTKPIEDAAVALAKAIDALGAEVGPGPCPAGMPGPVGPAGQPLEPPKTDWSKLSKKEIKKASEELI